MYFYIHIIFYLLYNILRVGIGSICILLYIYVDVYDRHDTVSANTLNVKLLKA